MRARQPHVQRHRAGLGREPARASTNATERTASGSAARAPDRGERLAAGVRAEDDQREQDRGRPGMGHHRVPLGRAARLAPGGGR